MLDFIEKIIENIIIIGKKKLLVEAKAEYDNNSVTGFENLFNKIK